MRMKCVIIEGPQGCGKTSLANYLREHIPSANLYRLAGQKDRTPTGKEKSKKMYNALIDYMDAISGSDINLVFDRTFFTEQVYSQIGFKEYDFTDVYEELLKRLGKLNYDIYYISLYLKDENIYKERLKREHHSYQEFSVENSVKQQDAYEKLIHGIKKLPNTKVYEVATDNYDEAYKDIDDILEVVRKDWE